MSDRRLQELERRWQETRALADEVAYLHEQLRVGVVDRDMVLMSAYLGDEASVRVCEGIEFKGWMRDAGVIEAGRGIGPLRIGVLLAYLPPVVTRLPCQRRPNGVVVYSGRNLQVFADATTGLVTQLIADLQFEGAFLGCLRVGCAFDEVVRVAGPIEDDDDDYLLLRDQLRCTPQGAGTHNRCSEQAMGPVGVA